MCSLAVVINSNEICIRVKLTTCTLLCKFPANDAFSGCFLSAFLAAFFALFSRKRFCSVTVSMLCCSQAPVNDWSNLGPHSVWCCRYCPMRFFRRSIPLLCLDISDGACCCKRKQSIDEQANKFYVVKWFVFFQSLSFCLFYQSLDDVYTRVCVWFIRLIGKILFVKKKKTISIEHWSKLPVEVDAGWVDVPNWHSDTLVDFLHPYEWMRIVVHADALHNNTNNSIIDNLTPCTHVIFFFLNWSAVSDC